MLKQYEALIVTPIKSEDFARQELIELMTKNQALNIKSLDKITGGIKIAGDLPSIFVLNYFLKVPTKILLRIAQNEKIKDLPRLYNWASDFPWHQYLGHPNPKWKISAATSRIIHTKKIEDTLKKAYEAYLCHQPVKKTWEKLNWDAPEIHIRLENDLMDVSLNISGTSLYKRNFHVIKGIAPIRENIASWLLLLLFEGYDNNSMTLIDPMCGSGTFLSEAQQFHLPHNHRVFTHEQCQLGVTVPSISLKKIVKSPLPAVNFIGIDKNQDLIKKNRLNPAFKSTEWIEGDFLEDTFHFSQSKKLAFIVNPPYGERIKLKSPVKFYEKLIQNILHQNPERFLIILPYKFHHHFEDIFQLKIHFKNGGLPVTALLYKRESSPLFPQQNQS